MCEEERSWGTVWQGLRKVLKVLSDSRNRCIRVAETHARIEEDLNEGLRVIRNHFQETASATLALTCGKSDRGHNEIRYLQETLWPWWHFAGQGYARRRLRDGRDWEASGAMTEDWGVNWWICELMWQLSDRVSCCRVSSLGWKGFVVVVVHGSVVMVPHLGLQE